MKKLNYSLLSIAITLGLAAYFFSNHTIRDVVDAIRNVPLPYIISFLCFSTLMSIFRTWRYSLLLLINGYRVPSHSLFFITIVRNLFADLLPARLGTLVYIYLVKTRLGVSLGAGTSSFSYSFLFDLIGNCPVILFCIISLNLPEQIPAKFLAAGVLVLLLLTVTLIIILPLATGIAARFCRNSRYSLVRNLSGILEDTRISLREVQNARVYDRILFLSIAIRLAKYAGLYVFLLGLGVSLGLDQKMLDPGISLLGLLSAELAASLPVSGIAGFGAYEGAWAFTFSLLGIDLRMAEITAVSHHVFTQIYAYSIGTASMLILLIPFFYRESTPPSKQQTPHMIRFYLMFVLSITSGIILALLPLKLYAQNENISDKSELSAIPSWSENNEKFPDIIFDSNREGSFGIYGYYLSTGRIIRIVSTPQHEMFPDINKKKSHLVFSRHAGLKRGGPSDIVLYSLKDGSETIIDEGAFPTFSTDGTKIFYEKNRSQVMQYSLEDKHIHLLFPDTGHTFGKYQIVKPRLSPDASKLVFTSDKGGRWHAWMVDLQNGEELKIGHGCEPVFHPGQNKVIWVADQRVKEGSGLKFYDLNTHVSGVFHDLDAPWGHEYFPSFSKDARFLIYSASSPGQHSHEHANYQIFLKDLHTSEVRKMTSDDFTNRWGKFVD